MPKRRGYLMLLSMVLLVAIGGCAEEEAPRQGAVEQPELDFATAAENRLAALDTRIEALEARVAELPEDRRARVDELLQSLETRQQVAQERLAAVKAGPAEGWEELRASTEEALNKLESTYNEIIARLEQET